MEKKVLEILGNASEEILTYTGLNMVDDDIIDSFGLISIISELEQVNDLTRRNKVEKNCSYWGGRIWKRSCINY